MKLKKILGIDIGGSGVKGAIVNTKKGEPTTERYRIPTPQPATPEAVAKVITKIAKHFNWTGPIGVGYPGVIQHGVARTAAEYSIRNKEKNAPARPTASTSPCVCGRLSPWAICTTCRASMTPWIGTRICA